MYNEEQKDRYIKFKESTSAGSAHILRCIFNKSEKLEEINGNDVYNFTRSQVEDLLYYVGAGTYYTVSLYYYGYSQYVGWALTQGLVRDGQNHFNEIEYSTLPIYINKNIQKSVIITRDELFNIIMPLENPRDKLFMVSCFEFGVGEAYKDFLNMKWSDVDENNLTLQLQERRVKVSREWIEIAREANETDFIITNVHNFAKEKRRKIELEKSDKLYKTTIHTVPTSSDKMLIQKRMQRVFVSIKKTLGLPPAASARSIVTSGKIYFIKEKAKEVSVDPIEYVKNNVAEIENQFGTKCMPELFIREYKDYLT